MTYDDCDIVGRCLPFTPAELWVAGVVAVFLVYVVYYVPDEIDF